MSKKLYEEDDIQNIANSIRSKGGTTAKLKVSDMSTAIDNISGGGKYAPRFISFYYYSGTELNDEISNLDISNMENLNYLFYYCQNLKELNLSSWDISNIQHLSNTFYYCQNLKELNLSGWNTSNAIDFYTTFGYCRALTNLDLSGWNTSKVTIFNQVFYNCSALTNLDLSGWNTSKVTTMYRMFSNCSSLTSLDLSSFTATVLTNTSQMFNYCLNLATLNIRNMDLNKVSSYSSMFNSVPTTCKIIVNQSGYTFMTNKFSSYTNLWLVPYPNMFNLSNLDVSTLTKVSDNVYTYEDTLTGNQTYIEELEIKNVTYDTSLFNNVSFLVDTTNNKLVATFDFVDYASYTTSSTITYDLYIEELGTIKTYSFYVMY